jgi:branched-chain amino acid transport system permease protein
MQLIQSIIDGLLIGATYSLIGIGFTLIFGVMHKINLAFAAASIAGAYVSWWINKQVGLPPLVVFVLATLAAGVIGYLIYLACFRFIPVHHPLATLMATVGMLLFIDDAIVHATDGRPQNYPALFDDVQFSVGPFALRGDYLLVFALSVLATALLIFVLYRTRLGIATRAVAQQPVAAQLCGISVGRTNATTFMISGALGGLAGAMVAASTGLLSPLISLPLTIKGLIVTVIGGLGSIPGAIAGGLIVGVIERVGEFRELGGVTVRDMYVMGLLFLFLTFWPGGLFGRSHLRD